MILKYLIIGDKMKKRFSALVFNFIFVTLIISRLIFGQSDVILPLAVGNYWEFIDSTFSNDTLFVVDTSKLGITGKLNIEYQGNNYEVFYWNWFDMNVNPPQPQSNKWLIRNEQDGLWEYGMLNDTDTLLLQNLSFKFPANIGDNWSIMAYFVTDTSISVGDTLIRECLDTDKEFITPSGTFQCYVYQYEWVFLKSSEVNFVYQFKFAESIYNSQNVESDTFRVLNYFAPNVGLVGQEVNLGSFKTKSYLSSYDLITDVNIDENNLSGFQLCQNYPNPFNPSTFIKYSIPNSSNVSINVYDILTLINENKQAGSYEIEFKATNLSSGIYFYRLQAGDYISTKKMILMK
jgi:hypothetical protein